MRAVNLRKKKWDAPQLALMEAANDIYKVESFKMFFLVIRFVFLYEKYLTPSELLDYRCTIQRLFLSIVDLGVDELAEQGSFVQLEQQDCPTIPLLAVGGG